MYERYCIWEHNINIFNFYFSIHGVDSHSCMFHDWHNILL